MRFIFAALLSASTALSAPSSTFAQETEKPGAIEIPIRSILIPEKGLDDAQPATAIMQVELPSVCHELGKTDVAHLFGNIVVRQLAVQRTDGDCAPDSGVMHSQNTVPLNHPLELGKLSAQRYNLIYLSSFNTVGWREFEVSASTLNPNQPKLARISGLAHSVPVQVGKPIELKITGTMVNPCVEISRMSVVQEGDTYLVSLTASMDPEVICSQQVTDFSEPITLPAPKTAGEYLIHASVAGTPAVQHVFTAHEQ